MVELFLTFMLIAAQLIVFATMTMLVVMFYRVEILYLNYKKLSRGTSNKSVYNSFCYGLITWLQKKKNQLPWYLIMFIIAYCGLIYLYNYRPSHQFYMTDYYWNYYTIKFLQHVIYRELAIMLIISIWLYSRIWFIKRKIIKHWVYFAKAFPLFKGESFFYLFKLYWKKYKSKKLK